MTDIIVTGGSGFIGTNIIQYLIQENISCINIDIKPPVNKEHMSHWRNVNILDKNSLKEIIGQYNPKYLLHLAARTDLNGVDLNEYEVNTEGVRNIAEIARDNNSIERSIFASTRLVCKIGYQPKSDIDFLPTTPYGESKVIGEKIVREVYVNQDNWVIVRPTSIWGPWFGKPYKNFFQLIEKGIYIHPKGIKIYKSFGYVGNIIHQIMTIINTDSKKVNKKIFYLSDYTPIEVLEWATQISNAFNSSKIRTVPMPILKIAAFIGDILKKTGIESPPLTSFRLENLTTQMILENDNLSSFCPSLPYSCEEGVIKTVKWLKDN